MPDSLATDTQRWQIMDLFDRCGITEIVQVRATAAKILKLDYLTDLRELTATDADELIGALHRALASKQVGDV